MMNSMFASVDRERSVSSMRRMKAPPWWRAKSQLNSAVWTLPTCRCPVGLGAKRTRTPEATSGDYPRPIKTVRMLGGDEVRAVFIGLFQYAWKRRPQGVVLNSRMRDFPIVGYQSQSW